MITITITKRPDENRPWENSGQPLATCLAWQPEFKGQPAIPAADYRLSGGLSMDTITPDPKKRGYLLPPGCKNLADVLRSDSPLKLPPGRTWSGRVNGKIRTQEVRVIGEQGQQLGIMSLVDALNLARAAGIDLVEVAPSAKPPRCRLVELGMFRYELAKKREQRK